MRKFTLKIITLSCIISSIMIGCKKDDSVTATPPATVQTTTQNPTPTDTTTTLVTTTPVTTTPTTGEEDGYIIIDGMRRVYEKARAGTGHPNYITIICEEYDHNIYIDIFGNRQKSPTETTTYKTRAGNPGLSELSSPDFKGVFIRGFFVRALYGSATSDTEVVTITVEGDKMRLTGKAIPMGNGKTMELDISVPLIK